MAKYQKSLSEFPELLKLDHITVVAPTLPEGVAHVQNCLGITVPFGTRHDYMGTHNHRLHLGASVYLEIVARDPGGMKPSRPRWFGLDDPGKIESDWNAGRRLRGWVANTAAIDAVVAAHRAVIGGRVALPPEDPTFDFAIPADGSLPLDGVAPSVIDHRGNSSYIDFIPDLGARLHAFILEHPDPAGVEALYRDLGVEHPPRIIEAPSMRYRALIETPAGLRELT
ncbi:riboflavin-specific deaminase [Agrobacterium sp. ATCC 31749]|uniref:VOC family protein n=1 Tax=unclassified Agrobacterium TaxID=2632611 RepID=UPI00020DB69A|nr:MULTISPECIES: VOC family protein [unclassified Agrobacterium]EGL67164.1 riboflavin-specific deaminase [Agrobacterium sp. ATCC 31749]